MISRARTWPSGSTIGSSPSTMSQGGAWLISTGLPGTVRPANERAARPARSASGCDEIQQLSRKQRDRNGSGAVSKRPLTVAPRFNPGAGACTECQQLRPTELSRDDPARPSSTSMPGDCFQVNLCAASAARCARCRRWNSMPGCASATRLRSPATSTWATSSSPAPRRSASCVSRTATGRNPAHQGHPAARRDARRGPAPAPTELLHSAKDRAENVMIVDLLRNDLGRVCDYGSVRVQARVPAGELSRPCIIWFRRCAADLRPGLGPVDLLRAAFPGGSVTGAAEGARDGDHRRAGADGARPVLRQPRLHRFRRHRWTRTS